MNKLRLQKTLRLPIALIGSLTLASLSNADTLTDYHFVADQVKTGATQDSPNSGRCSVATVLNDPNAYSTYIEYTAWDAPGGRGSTIGDYISRPTGASQYNFGGTSNTETEFGRLFYLRYSSSTYVGLGTTPDTFGGTVNNYITKRNFRVIFNGVAFKGPQEMSYSNIVDGGTYRSLPSTTDVNSGASGIGFRGFAAPYYYSNKINLVYFSLEQPNGLYWNGSAWSHLRVNIPASRRVVNSLNRTEWSKVGGLPSGSNLPNGVYYLRTMALEGSFVGTGAGKLNTISFTIDSSAPLSSQQSSVNSS